MSNSAISVPCKCQSNLNRAEIFARNHLFVGSGINLVPLLSCQLIIFAPVSLCVSPYKHTFYGYMWCYCVNPDAAMYITQPYNAGLLYTDLPHSHYPHHAD